MLYRGNNFSDVCIDIFFMNLAENTCLRSLFFNDTKLSDNNLKVIDYMLCKNTALRELNLSNCSIRDDGLRFITPSLMKNTTIQTLHLFSNPLTEESLFYLLNVLENFNETLQTVTLYQINIDEEHLVLQEIKDLLKQNFMGKKRLDQQVRQKKLDDIFIGDSKDSNKTKSSSEKECNNRD